MIGAIAIERLPAPHVQPSSLPAGKMTVYVFQRGLARLPKPHIRSIDEAKSALVRQLTLSAVPHKEVVRQNGVGSGTVSKIRRQPKANVMLFRNTEGQICVPTACPNQNIASTKA